MDPRSSGSAENGRRCEVCGNVLEDIKACRQKCKGCGREIDCEDSGFMA